MALDFYYSSDKKLNSVLFSLDDIEFETLRPVVVQFRKLTGIVIDQYGKTRLHHVHVQLIIELIEELVTLKNESTQLYKQLLIVKEKFASVNADLIAVGD